jgi:hypothetical protein
MEVKMKFNVWMRKFNQEMKAKIGEGGFDCEDYRETYYKEGYTPDAAADEEISYMDFEVN